MTSVVPASKPSMYVTREIVVTRLAANQAKVSETFTVYAQADTTCSGVARGTVSVSGSSGGSFSVNAAGVTSNGGYASITLAGTGSVTNGASTVTASLANVQRNSWFLGSESMYFYGGDVAGNAGFGLYGGDFVTNTFKDAYYVNGNTLTVGLNPGASYPTALGTTAAYIYTKQ